MLPQNQNSFRGSAREGEIHRPMPHDGSALASYISSEKAFKGIGPARAKALHDKYANELYTALLECWLGVVQVIGEDNAIIAAATMRERVAELDVIDALDELDLCGSSKADIPDPVMPRWNVTKQGFTSY